MTSVDMNKEYIRDNIAPSQQQQFYEFFVNLEDHDQFQSWDMARTIQVVTSFKAQQFLNQLNSPINQQILSSPKHKLANAQFKMISPSQLLQIIQNNTETRVPSVEHNLNENLYSSLNLLSLIENEKAIRIPENLTDKSQNFQLEANEKWLKKADQINVAPYQGKDIFQLFDTFIKQNDAGQQNTLSDCLPKKDPQSEKNVKVSITKQDVIKDQTLQKRDQTAQILEAKRQCKRKKIKDRLFKWKLQSKIKCVKNEAVINCQNFAIVGHQMVHRIFLPDYAIYRIKIWPLSSQIKRTYDDFIDLRNILQKQFPCIKIPYLQNKSWLAESDISLINRNKTQLYYFLKRVLQHPVLSKSWIVKSFLEIESHKMVKKKHQEYQNLAPITSLAVVSNQKGYAQVILSEEQHRLVQQTPKWQTFIELYFQKSIDILASLVSQYEAVIQTFSQLSSLSSEMCSHSSNFNLIRQNHTQFLSFFSRQEVYYQKCSKEMQRYVLNIKDKILPFLKYEKTDINSFTPLIDRVTDLAEGCIKRMENEPQSPSSQPSQPCSDQSNDVYFAQGIWQQSDSVTSLKYQVGYLSYQLVEQSKQFSKRLLQNISAVWEQLMSGLQATKQTLVSSVQRKAA